MSDLHLEFYNKFRVNSLPEDKETILILAGDIIAGKNLKQFEPFFKDVSTRFAEVIWVFGNHEFYNGSILRAPEKAQKAIAEKYPNIHIFNNKADVFIKDDVVFVCATLWTDFNKGNPNDYMTANNGMNDFKRIRTGPPSSPYQKKFQAHLAHCMHMEQLRNMCFLFEEHKDKTIVVVSHHAPCSLSADEGFRGKISNSAYYSDLSEIIHKYEPKIWFHGHMHTNSDYQLFNTRVICNPKGYAMALDEKTGEEVYQNKGFNQLLRIEL